MFKLAIISSLVILSSFNVYAQEKEQIDVWEEPSKSFAITKAIADFEAINDCEIKLREISSAKQLDVLKEHIKNGERIPDVMVTISDKFGQAQEDHLLMPLDFMTNDRKIILMWLCVPLQSQEKSMHPLVQLRLWLFITMPILSNTQQKL